jgi:hypothetical protein
MSQTQSRRAWAQETAAAVRHYRPKRLKLTAPEPNENQLQAAVADLLTYAFKGQPVAWTHFPAGGYELNPSARSRLQRLGLQPGFPDLLIQWHYGHSLWIEMKTSRGRLSDDQKFRHALLERVGIPVAICRSINQVLAVLKYHRVPTNKLVEEVRHGNTSTESSSAPQPT